MILEAEPAPGFRFVAWEEDGAVIGTSPLLRFTAETDRVLIARFEKLAGPPELSGRWEGKLSLLPGLALESSRLELEVKRELLGLRGSLAVVAGLSASGWSSFAVKGTLTGGAVSLTGGLAFGPSVPGYKSGYLGLAGDWAGLRWSLRVSHSAFGGVPPGPYFLYTLNLYFSPFSFTVRGEEGSTGLRFKDLLARISEVPFLHRYLGIRAQGSLSFTKEEGLAYLDLQLSNLIQLCCGISLDVRVKFTPVSKEVFLTPRWARLSGCLTVYGDIDWDEEEFSIGGMSLYGYRIRCCLDCGSCPGARISAPYLEFTSALDPAHVPGGFREEEFEYWRAGTCGPACCGGYWTLDAAVYFSHSGTMFDLSRLALAGSIPLFPGLTWEWKGELDLVGGDHALEIGWRWDF